MGWNSSAFTFQVKNLLKTGEMYKIIKLNRNLNKLKSHEDKSSQTVLLSEILQNLKSKEKAKTLLF